jgi:membrane-associated phospholipid phosphatase
MKININNRTRLLWIILTLASMLIYLPINRLISGGTTLELPIDSYIPLIPIFIFPYLGALLFWVFTIIYINLTQDKKTLVTTNLIFIIATLTSALIYVVLPTFVASRPTIIASDIPTTLLKWLYENDRVYNAAPSGHTFYTVISLLIWWTLKPKYRTIFVIISGLIILSTIFTHQHYILDLITGIIFALVIYYSINRQKILKV